MKKSAARKQCFGIIGMFIILGSVFGALAVDDGIHLNAFVVDGKVPQNRFVELIIRLSWSGDLDRYEVKPFDNPILTNLEISGTGSTNRVAAEGGVTTVVREYTYQLKPQSIGMAYVEPIIILYTDLETNLQSSLTTGRIPVQIVDPVRESSGAVTVAVLATIAVAASVWGISRFRKKRADRQKTSEPAPVLKPIDELYWEELRASIDPNDYSLDGGQAVAKMSRLLRRFLHEKYGAPGLEATSSELYRFLYEQKFEDRFINEVRDLLSAADLIKFSGRSVERHEVMLTQSRIETILVSSLRGEIQRSAV